MLLGDDAKFKRFVTPSLAQQPIIFLYRNPTRGRIDMSLSRTWPSDFRAPPWRSGPQGLLLNLCFYPVVASLAKMLLDTHTLLFMLCLIKLNQVANHARFQATTRLLENERAATHRRKYKQYLSILP